MYQNILNFNFIIDREISPNFYFVEDIHENNDRIKQLKFHIESGDYFATLATIISVAVEEKNIRLINILSSVIEDLEYLQKNYEIVKKKPKERKLF